MQVPLQFEFQSNQTFASFYPGSNTELLNQLQALVAGSGEQQLYLWGEAGSGKSHLLQACCQQAKAIGCDPFYCAIPAAQLPPIGLLDGLDEVPLVCLDDIHHVSEDAAWQQALFGFYNAHRQRGHRLVISANCPPKFLPMALSDLKTRMAWGLTFKIQGLQDDQLIAALAHKARYLGFDIPPAVGQFLLHHYVHDMTALWQLLERIDHATLAAKRKLTLPFLKQILADVP
jgi:DnaA family protein